MNTDINALNDSSVMNFYSHLKEFRKRLIFCAISVLLFSVISYIFFSKIIFIFTAPFEFIPLSGSNPLVVHSLVEGFLTRMKVSLLCGLLFAFPIIIYQALRFIFPGLMPREKQIVIITLAASFFLILISTYMGYFKIIPFSVKFLLGHSFIPENVGVLLNYNKNIFYIFQFLIVSMALFQLPLILELLMIMNIVSRKKLFKLSRYVVIAIFILSAVLTPPDIISQLSIAVPLCALFFLTILIAAIFHFGEET